jgi:hypothetical protein
LRAVRFAPLKTVLVAACVGVAATASACGGHEKVTEAKTEGGYVDVGTVAYQVQISRTLNPKLPEDKSYLVGIPAADKKPLRPDEQWFAVFVRGQNFGDKPQPLVTKFRVIDTEGKTWDPIKLDTETNTLAWNPTAQLDPTFIYPDPSSIAGTGPVRQGSLLLFRLDNSIYENRPLVLELFDPAGGKEPVAEIPLDL